MQKHLWNESQEEMLVQTHGETEAGPVMTILETLQSIGLEIHLSIEIFFVKRFQGNLALALILGAVVLAVEVEVVFHRPARVRGLFIFARRNRRRHRPKHHQDRDRGEDGKEDGRVESTPNLAGKVVRDRIQEQGEQDIGEAITARRVGGDRRILDRGILYCIIFNSIQFNSVQLALSTMT